MHSDGSGRSAGALAMHDNAKGYRAPVLCALWCMCNRSTPTITPPPPTPQLPPPPQPASHTRGAGARTSAAPARLQRLLQPQAPVRTHTQRASCRRWAHAAIVQRSGMGAWCVCARTCCRTSSSAARAPATRSCEHAQKDLAEDVHMHMAIAWKGCMGARRVCGGRGATQTSVRTARAASPSPHPCAARWAQDGASGIIALVRRLGPAGLTGDTLVSYPLDRSYSRWRSWYKSPQSPVIPYVDLARLFRLQ